MKKNILVKTLLLVVVAIIMCLSLTGCGFIKNSAEIEEAAKEFSNVIENSNENKTNDSDDLKLYSDNNKIVFESGQGKMVFTYSGNKITGYSLYMEYENATLANVAANVLKANNDSEIKNISTQGKYVVIEYNESEYEDLTVEDVKTAYSYLKEVKD